MKSNQLRYLFFITLHLLSYNNSFSQWSHKNMGLNGGNVLSLIEYNGLIFAGADKAGVFISVNNGDSWVSSNNGMPRDPSVTSLARIGNTIFAGLFNGSVYKSNNNGATWLAPSNFNSPYQITSLYASGNNLFAGSVNGLYMSSDFGNTWVSKDIGFPTTGNRWVNTITATSTSLIVGLFFNGAYRSNDNGNTWQELEGIPSNGNVESITVDGGKIVAGVSNSGIYLSIDNGDSWTSLGGILNKSITSLSYIGNTLYAGTFFHGLYKSTNNGSSWTSVNLGRTNTVNSIISQGTSILVGTSDGVYRSSNNGSTWSTANINLNAIPINSIKAAGSKVLAGAEFSNGLFLSNDQAATWSSVILPTSSSNTERSLTYIKNDSLIGSQGGLVKLSTNSGVNWNDYVNSNVYSFSILVNNGDVLRGTGEGLYVYKKNGSGWNLITNGINPNQWISSLTKVGTTIFAGTILGQGVLRSSDNGLTWSPANNGFDAILPSIVGVYTSQNRLFAVTNGNSFYYSNDLGNSWILHTQSFDGFINEISFSNGFGFMANSNGVMYSLNNGETWVDSGNLFPSHLSSYSVSSNSDNVFAGTSAGVWGIPLSVFFPTISSFLPASGEIGTAVVIDGTNFTSPEFLTVKFNGVLADIISSTATKIIVNVPTSATTGPVTVEVNGRLATSSQNFCVTPTKPEIALNLSDPLNPKLVSSSLSGNQWFYNGVILAGATSQVLLPINSGSYYVQVTFECSSPISDTYCFNIPKPTISSDFTDIAKPKLIASSETGNQWFRDGVKINDATDKIYFPDESGSFSVSTTKFGCTSQLSDAVAVLITGDISHFEYLTPPLTIYPSPTTSFITIDLNINPNNDPIKLTIHDMLGRHIKTIENITNSIHIENVSDFASGIYLVRVNQLDKVYQARFTKN